MLSASLSTGHGASSADVGKETASGYAEFLRV